MEFSAHETSLVCPPTELLAGPRFSPSPVPRFRSLFGTPPQRCQSGVTSLQAVACIGLFGDSFAVVSFVLSRLGVLVTAYAQNVESPFLYQ